MANYRWQDCNCRECECMDMNDVAYYDSSKRYCTERHEYYNPNDTACSRMRYDETRKPSTSSTCYLTTMISNILRHPDNGHALRTLRKFRNEYMLNHPETYPILIEYDIVGPKIAKQLNDDPLNIYIAREFYLSYIKPIVSHIEHEEYGIAISKYQDMTNRFKNFYHIDDEITEKLDINIKTLGKSRA